jgi:hypothetical protein
MRRRANSETNVRLPGGRWISGRHHISRATAERRSGRHSPPAVGTADAEDSAAAASAVAREASAVAAASGAVEAEAGDAEA